MKYAAYDDIAICGIGDTPDEAIQDAFEQMCEPGTQLKTAPISYKLAAQIDRDGWNCNLESFAIRDGCVVVGQFE